jgi:threonine dehydrogenase-like Zn-dependent dehydrogenase
VRALTVEPGRAASVQLEERPAPVARPGDVVVDAVAVGICGTDREIVDGSHGEAPERGARLVLGHEGLGRVASPGGRSALTVGDLVVAMVREPDPRPCPACAAGEWDMCTDGGYREHGIKQLDGFACERWVLPPERLVRVPPALGSSGVLVEPASIVAKAWEQIGRIGGRASWAPRRVLVTGAGPIGLLAALLGVQQGFDVHVLDIVTSGPKPDLVADLGATYHHGEVSAVAGADIVVECTGVGDVVVAAVGATAPNSIVCLTGLTTGGRRIAVDVAGLNRELVLENDTVFGSVSANRRHYELAVAALAAAEPTWLERLVTRHVPLERWPDALTARPDDVKVVIDLE